MAGRYHVRNATISVALNVLEIRTSIITILAFFFFFSKKLMTTRPKLSKYSEGYPGDSEERFAPSRRELKTIRVHVRWTCHTCQTVFKDLEKQCRTCGHDRCDKCVREPPEEEEESLDEAAVEKISDMIRNVNIAPQAPAA